MRFTALFGLPLVYLLATGCGNKNGTPSTASTPSNTQGASAVAAVSKYDSGPRAAEEPVDAARAKTGQGLFSTKGCTACHAFGLKMSGPDMAGVTRRRTSAWMAEQILHPEVMTKQDPIAHQLFATHALQMPNQGLTQDEARSVIEYLKAHDRADGAAH